MIKVLRFPVNQLAAETIEPVIDLVLEAIRFRLKHFLELQLRARPRYPYCFSPRVWLSTSAEHCMLRMASHGYCTYPTPGLGVPASKVLGVVPASAQGQGFPNDYSLGNSTLNAPLAVFTNGNTVFVADPVQPGGALHHPFSICSVTCEPIAQDRGRHRA